MEFLVLSAFSLMGAKYFLNLKTLSKGCFNGWAIGTGDGHSAVRSTAMSCSLETTNHSSFKDFLTEISAWTSQIQYSLVESVFLWWLV